MEKFQYKLSLKNNTDKGRDIYDFVSADGILPKNKFADEDLALANTVAPNIDDDILIVQSGFGFLGILMADKAPEGTTIIAETSDRAHQIIKKNINKNEVDNGTAKETAFYKNINREFDKILYSPKAYEPNNVVKNRLSTLTTLLKSSGELYISGKKQKGIKRYYSHLKEIGECEKIQKGKNQVYRYKNIEGSEPVYFDIDTRFAAEVKGKEITFEAREGLFSLKTLDKGTKLLLDTIDLEKNEKTLDIACGYGAIAIYLKKLFNAEIYLADDNAIATKYAERNLANQNIEDYTLKNKDCLDGFKNQKFDTIVSNPPTHQDKGVTSEITQRAHNSLKKGGELYIVYNQNMKYENKLEQIFSKVKILEKKNNYSVAKAVK